MMMVRVRNCTLCEELSGNSAAFEHEYASMVATGSNILLEDRHFTVLPSIGPLNAHHLLIVTNDHYKAISEINTFQLNEIRTIIDKIIRYNQDKFSLGTIFFEHGSCVSDKNDASCLEHAHLHCVGTTMDILNQVLDHYPFVRINFPELLNFKKSSYQLYIDLNGSCWINNSNIVQSQFFRQVYAAVNQISEQWNWRLHPRIETVKHIILKYKDLKTFIRR